MSSETFEINSYDRTQGNPNDFNVLVPNNMKTKTSFKLVSANIPLNLYNITLNNNFFLYNDGGDKYVTVPAGYYTVTSLCTALQSAMTLLGGTYTVAFNNTTKSVTISALSNFSLFLDARSPLLETLGFVLNNTATTPALSRSSDLCPDLYPTELFIMIKDLSTNEIQSTGNKSYSFYIPIVTSDSQINTVYGDILGKQKIEAKLNTTMINVQLVDRKMQLVQLRSNWSFTLVAKEC